MTKQIQVRSTEEALKLALEALDVLGWQPTEEAMDYRDNAITAIREALAEQPAQQEPAGYFRLREYGSALIHDQVSEDAKHNEGVFPLYTAPQPAQQQEPDLRFANPIGLTPDQKETQRKQFLAQQQEPVAYMGTDIEGNPNKFRLNPFGGCVPLYEKPQSVKVWDAEGYDALCQELEGWKAKASKPWVGLTDKEVEDVYRIVRPDVMKFWRECEAKLKEKNT